MNNIDIKSVIIGVLGTVLVFVSIGATDKNLGDIVVSSIKIVDENGQLTSYLGTGPSGGGYHILINDKGFTSLRMGGSTSTTGGYLEIYDSDETLTSEIRNFDNEEGVYSGGFFTTYNGIGHQTTYLGTGENQVGVLTINNGYDERRVSIAASQDGDGGYLQVYNKHDVQVGYFGSGKSNDGLASLSDRYGDIGWTASGKQ